MPQSEIRIFDYQPTNKKPSNRVKVIHTDKTKTHCVFYNGKIISWHIDFYLAQCAVEKHLRTGKIGNGYEILSKNQLSCTHKNTNGNYCLDCLRKIKHD